MRIGAGRKLDFDIFIKKIMKYILSFLFACIVCLNLDAQTIYIVRHGEKSSAEGVDLRNPPLSEKGLQRAKDLQKTLDKKNIDLIYVTNTFRSKQTAEQVAKAKGITPEVYNPMPDLKWIQSLLESKKDILIVAHSNTIHHIYNLIQEAAGKEKTVFEHSEDVYNSLYTFNVKKPAKLKIKVSSYGEGN